MIDLTEKTVHVYSPSSAAIIAQYDGCMDHPCALALQRALIYGHWQDMDEQTRDRASKTIEWLDAKIKDYKYGSDR